MLVRIPLRIPVRMMMVSVVFETKTIKDRRQLSKSKRQQRMVGLLLETPKNSLKNTKKKMIRYQMLKLNLDLLIYLTQKKRTQKRLRYLLMKRTMRKGKKRSKKRPFLRKRNRKNPVQLK